MNTQVTFELAKLLKEKGYKDKNILGTVRLSEPKYYDPNGIIHGIKDAFEEKNYKIEDCFNAPTIAEVVMWLYEKHGIWIVVNPHKGEDDLGKPFMEFDPEVWSFTNECIFHNTKLLYFNSPIEAYETAIEYVLNNLV